KNEKCRFVRPMSSRSLCFPPARTHFCTETARGYGGVSSPVKKGLNGTMPATVNSSVLSTGITLADGTWLCPRSVKHATKAARNSSAVVGTSGICRYRLLSAGHAVVRFQLGFPGAHGVAALGDGGLDVVVPAVGDLGGDVALGHAPNPSHERPRRTQAE